MPSPLLHAVNATPTPGESAAASPGAEGSAQGTKVSTAHAVEWVESLENDDIDQQAQAQGGWHLHYEQLSQGRFHGRLLRAALPGLTLLREDTNTATLQRGALGQDVYGFALPLRNQESLHFNGRAVPPDAFMVGRGHEIDLRTPEDFSLLAIVVDRSLLGPLWESLYHKPLARWLEHQMVLPTTAVKAGAVRELHLSALEQAVRLHEDGARADDPAMLRLRDDVLIEWMEALPPAVDTSELPSLERRKRVVDRACQEMLAQPEESPSVLELCQRLGISRRKLNYCFQDVLGTTPVKYLRVVRLNGVQRALRRAGRGVHVQDVAAQWGFWHLGQFALDYRKQFGERPSETLRTARLASLG